MPCLEQAKQAYISTKQAAVDTEQRVQRGFQSATSAVRACAWPAICTSSVVPGPLGLT